ncbi:polya polymerase [Anaerobium acetethylicum]|uniref:Polya polymerase n=1 Tax=Anaerobium acetethylicum TaxID=1619234 RepID=A0A1D3TW69_9FIRM|nr:polya polymerase [Anaerobium acetethylicum]SCP98423.1 hypothetical protein SAMN05421730_102036 [Anaerobium acetethylicum]
MKLKKIENIDKFLQVLDSCIGNVELVTTEGDRLNLKSKLSQYLFMANFFSEGMFNDVELIAYEREDIDKLFYYIANNA